VTKGFADAKTRVDAVYQQPFLAHATMEPVNCTVSVRADGCDIWVGTQVPTRAVDAGVRITGLPADKITVHNHLLGGGFGRRLETDFIAQALKVGKQLNTPVKVVWTREEDVQHDMYRPYDFRWSRRKRQADCMATPDRGFVDPGTLRATRIQEWT